MKFLLSKLSGLASVTARTAKAVENAYAQGKKIGNQVKSALSVNKEDVVVMKKSTLIAILAALSAVIGVLVAMCVYLRRRESELDEYEQLLFSEDFSHEEAEDEADETESSDEILPEPAPAEEEPDETKEEA